MSAQKPGVIEKFRQVAAVQTRERNALCPNTQSTYIHWLRLFWKFMAPKAAREWTGQDVETFMWHLKEERYADKSRRQALCALVYVFKNVLKLDPGTLNLPAMPKEKNRVKIIPSREELARIFSGMKGQTKLMAALMYGSGLRVQESCELRLKDVDFETLTIRIHGGKGDKDRLCVLPENLVPAVKRQIAFRLALHESLHALAGFNTCMGEVTGPAAVIAP